MHWIVILFVLAVFAGIVYQLYLAGHLLLLAIGVPVALVAMYARHRLENRR